MRLEARFKQIYRYKIGNKYGITKCIEPLEINSDKSIGSKNNIIQKNLSILDEEFHNSSECVNIKEVNNAIAYKFRYTKIGELSHILIFKKNKYIDNLYELLIRNTQDNGQKNRNRKSETVNGIFNDFLLHDGLASYGIIIDLVNKEVTLNGTYNEGRKLRV